MLTLLCCVGPPRTTFSCPTTFLPLDSFHRSSLSCSPLSSLLRTPVAGHEPRAARADGACADQRTVVAELPPREFHHQPASAAPDHGHSVPHEGKPQCPTKPVYSLCINSMMFMVYCVFVGLQLTQVAA